MQALEGWLNSRWRVAALLALAALLAAGAFAFAPRHSVDAQTPNANVMQTGNDDDRTNFRLELSLVDDSDNIVPANSNLRVKAVIKFDVPSDKTEGQGPTANAADHGNFGTFFFVQGGGTLRIAGQFEWENAGGRTLRIDPDRTGSTDTGDRDPASPDDTCRVGGTSSGAFIDDFTGTAGRVLYSTTVAGQRNFGATSCGTPPTTMNNRVLAPRADDWKRIAYSGRGILGDHIDVLPDRDGDQGPCKPSTTDDVTTWTCEITLVDDKFGWAGYDGYSALNGQLTATSTPVNWDNWSLLAQRPVPNDSDASITIPAGTPDGTFTISGSVILHSSEGRVTNKSANNTDKITLTDSLTVTIGTVSEAASAEFGFATQIAGDLAAAPLGRAGDPWPGLASASDGKSKLQLRILNEGGKPSARNSVSSIVMRTNIGTLTSNIDDGEAGPGDGCVGTGALTCQVQVSSLNTTNSGNIVFTLNSPANNKAGTAQVTGSVVNSRGEVLSIDTLSVVFVGTASAISVSEPTSSILNVNTTGTDNRDRLDVSVSAADSAGQRAQVPGTSRSFTLRGPDNNRVTPSASGINVEWPLNNDATPAAPILDANNNLQARISVGAAAASPLKTGEYTLEIRAGGLRDSVTFTVAGEAANIEVVSSESEYRPNDQFTLTATVTNADGSTVPDGTEVTFTVGSEVAGQAKIVQLRGPSGTKNGEASARYVVIAEGRAWVTVTAGNGNGIWIDTVGQAAAPPAAADPAEQLSGKAGLQSYLGDADVSASTLLEALGNVTAIRLYRAGVWVLYGSVDGRPIPGSEDFTVSRGNVLWIGS